MPKAPTTFEALRNAVRTDREALTLAAVLPNLPEDDRIVGLRGWSTVSGTRMYETDDATIDELRRRETPVVPGSSLYRVRPDTKASDEYDLFADPVPHGFRTYQLKRCDLIEFVRVDPEDAEFDDTDQTTLTDFGFGNPYYNPWEANRDAFERNPKLPI